MPTQRLKANRPMIDLMVIAASGAEPVDWI